ncbi:hypothetical protein KEM48_011328 [Puccinia striiformis f. sp. tritici PST-130]|uniref:glucan endo-1,3-beta-D-glucosidase n=1 Tax=Puccinia striiformis f. sp. tritici PST-78 TaxID=1165861 RepID=A0A0L0V1N1_9BASI|nr:hypothetical protein Pst134EB_006385 [Puccinia striiformis f. sp. tritici]KAI9628933.1 hypothetical protein KEM48_011328 [Puccinia striiformis f. sp. tritici PST-130]KNE93173.1 hypothetical protein PSTG_13425 [Puccinia striiformis f. sp. tritici PST-78]
MSCLQGSQVDGDLFAPVDSQRKHAAPPLPLFGQGCAHPQLPLHISEDCRHRPIGTNKWYTQLMLTPNGTDPIYPLPYAMAFLDGDSVLSRPGGKDSKPLIGLGILHSTASQRVFGPPVGQEADSSVRYYYNPVTVSVCFGAKEFSPSNIVPSMSNWSELAVQFELSLPTNLSSKSRISFPISRGSAYVTALYTALTPTLGSTHSIISLECANVGEEHHLYGFRKHRIGYSDGSIWLVYSLAQQAGCTSHLNLQKITPTDLGHPGAWSGIIQLVKMSDHYGRQLEENSHRESEEFVYDHGIGVWTHAATLRSGPMGSGQYSFDWITGGPRCNSVAPLMFALPHHTEALSDPTIVVKPEIRMQSRVTGVMRLCRAARWLFKENVADLRRYGIKPDYLPNGPPLYDALKIDLLRQVMVKEIDTDFDAESDLDSYYFSGKKLAKQALQCLTASSILQDRDLAGKFVEKTKKSFDKFCRNRSKAAPLVYENTWKGIISSSILRTGNRNDDFGNGVYNDHHFHYAYFIHTAAVLVYHDHSYLHSIRDYVHDLIRDVNNSDQSDPYFPLFRNFDWFLGHSLATGLDTNIDGKNQESCSEDANFLYSVKVWAEVTQNPRLGALADLQLSLFKRSVNHYYFMQEANTNAPACFKGNRVPGILFENKADYTTFFSNEKDAIHMIQVIPITPITSFIRSPEFIWQEWINTGSPTENTRQVCQIATKLANGYQTLLLTQYGIVDPNYVYNIFVKKLWMGQEIPLDDGLSLSWILGFLINQIELNKSEEKNGC